MRRLKWNHLDDAGRQVEAFAAEASEPGFLAVEFAAGGSGSNLPWSVLEPWTRSRAVTLAVVEGSLGSPALDIALCSDLVYLVQSASLRLARGTEAPSAGVVWALGRAGRRALARGLLSTADLGADEAAELGIAHGVVADSDTVPWPDDVSLAAASAARDLMRSGLCGSSGLQLELAAFRLLVASGDPERGARAFLEKRKPDF